MRSLTLVLVLAACKTTLGPMPATTGIAALPEPAAAAEVKAGGVPGYDLSDATQDKPHGNVIGELSLAVDPGHLVPGAVVGARIFGPSGDTLFEPMIGYRREVGERYALAAFAFATQGSATMQSATYTATQAGGELAADARLLDRSKWFEVHVLASVSVTGVSADGSYCQDPAHMHGVDCPDPPAAPTNVTAANVSGAYPSATGGLAFDLLRHHDSVFHGARLEGLVTGGMMPHVVAGDQVGGVAYLGLGLALTISAGAH